MQHNVYALQQYMVRRSFASEKWGWHLIPAAGRAEMPCR